FRTRDRSIVERRARCPKCRAAFVVEHDVEIEDPFTPADDDESVRKRPPRRRPPKQSRRRPFPTRRVLAIASWCAIGAAMLCAAGMLFLVDWKGIINKTGLFADSPEKVAAKLETCKADVQTMLAAQTSERSRLDNIDAAERRLADLFLRVSRLEPVADVVYDEVLQRHPGAFADGADGGRDLLGALQSAAASRPRMSTDPRDREIRSQLALNPDDSYRVVKEETVEHRDPFGQTLAKWQVTTVEVKRENPLEAGQRQKRRTNKNVQKNLGSISTLKLKQHQPPATQT